MFFFDFSPIFTFGKSVFAPDRARTCDLTVNSRLLYLLSYRSIVCSLHFGLLKIKFGWIAVMKTSTFGKSGAKPLQESLAQPFPKVESSPSGN
jgi:hypothetical protein